MWICNLTLELGEGQEHVRDQAAHGGGIERLRDGDKGAFGAIFAARNGLGQQRPYARTTCNADLNYLLVGFSGAVGASLTLLREY